ncbi:cytochrome P450 [Streptomyces sp. NPDC048518]|uniref:cytochrome P450 n=1 Tax=Streptomyces sp. NPDC048518 TaxID=3155029 RepID=UPI00340EF229
MTYVTARAPGALPVLGHAWPLLRRPFAFFKELPRYGDLAVVRIGSKPVYVPCHPDLVRKVLTDDRTFDKGGLLFEKSTRDLFGNGLATCPHADHRKQRRLMQPAFHHQRLEQYGITMVDAFHRVTGSWGAGKVIDVYAEMFRVALQAAARTLFGIPTDDETFERFQQCAEAAFPSTIRRSLAPGVVSSFPLPANRRYRDTLRLFHRTVDQVIAQYQDAEEDYGDLISILFRTGPERLTEREVHDQVTTILVAGTETIAANLSWALHLLTQNQQYERRLRKELKVVLQGDNAAPQNLSELTFARQVIVESLRLYPPVWLTTRTVTHPTRLADTAIPAGATIGISPLSMHYSAKNFDQPSRFNPDRWSNEKSAGSLRAAYIPFGGGARKCIGDTFGIMETTLLLASLVQKWKFRPTAESDASPRALESMLRPRRLLLSCEEAGKG